MQVDGSGRPDRATVDALVDFAHDLGAYGAFDQVQPVEKVARQVVRIDVDLDRAAIDRLGLNLQGQRLEGPHELLEMDDQPQREAQRQSQEHDSEPQAAADALAEAK